MTDRKVPMMQAPNTQGFMELFEADPGHSFVYLDYSAAEPHVLAYYSRDENLLKIYQNGRPSNDIYLFYGYGSESYGEKVKATGYEPDNPTKESIKLAKKTISVERSQCKTIVLGQMYGMGWNLLQKRIELEGYQYTEAQARQAVKDFRARFPGIKYFEKHLKDVWEQNGGWFHCGRGTVVTIRRPFKIWSDKYQKLITIDDRKDIVNRFVQRTAHKLLERYIWFINQERLKYPDMRIRPVRPDQHDSTTWQCKTEHVPALKEIFQEQLLKLNQELQWDVTLKGDVKVGQTLADFLEG